MSKKKKASVYKDENSSRIYNRNLPTFTLEPYLRFEGQPGEQRTMFIKDPSDNHIEFKSFRNIDMVFATDLDEKIEET